MSHILAQDVKDARGKLIVKAGEDVFAWAQLMDYPEDYRKKKSRLKDSLFFLDDFNSIFKKEPYVKVLGNWVEDFREWMGEQWVPAIMLEELQRQKELQPYNYWHVVTMAVVGARFFDLWIKTPATGKKAFQALLFHDLGKTRIDSFVLDKRGPLNDDDWKVIKQAPLISYALNVTYWNDPNHLCANIALSQKENRLGSGYPRGLKTNSLILDVLNVLDRFDAMITERPYREKAFTAREAIDFIKKDCDDGKIDADFLKALLALIRGEKIKDLKKVKIGAPGREA